MAKGRKTGGRQPGSPNRMTRELREMVLGALDKAGGEDYLIVQSRENAPAFLALVGKCLPKDVNLNAGVKLSVKLVGTRRT